MSKICIIQHLCMAGICIRITCDAEPNIQIYKMVLWCHCKMHHICKRPTAGLKSNLSNHSRGCLPVMMMMFQAEFLVSLPLLVASCCSASQRAVQSVVKSPVAQLFIAARNLAREASLVRAAALQDPCVHYTSVDIQHPRLSHTAP